MCMIGPVSSITPTGASITWTRKWWIMYLWSYGLPTIPPQLVGYSQLQSRMRVLQEEKAQLENWSAKLRIFANCLLVGYGWGSVSCDSAGTTSHVISQITTQSQSRTQITYSSCPIMHQLTWCLAQVTWLKKWSVIGEIRPQFWIWAEWFAVIAFVPGPFLRCIDDDFFFATIACALLIGRYSSIYRLVCTRTAVDTWVATRVRTD